MFAPLHITTQPDQYRSRILSFLDAYKTAVMLDSNSDRSIPAPLTGTHYSYIVAAGVLDEISSGDLTFNELQKFIDIHRKNQNWVFGYLSYDLKNEIENLNSSHPCFSGFPVMHFFVPQILIIANDQSITITSALTDPGEIWSSIISGDGMKTITPEVAISHTQSRETYLSSIHKILNHIHRGDIYEMNYCHEVALVASTLNPVSLFHRLTELSPNPFSTYYRTQGCHLICSSPERFITRKGSRVLSQPIKGTAARSDDAASDKLNLKELKVSEKEMSENVMIVDLVRNDLSKIAQKGSVKVDELFGVYSFPAAHQMISTISCNIKPEITFTDIIKAAFPMGSMTGAPKVSAMKLIEKFEVFRRGLFSGTAGYIKPDGDFDFNVIIRSILYNEKNNHVSVAAGGAITAESEPEKEFQETMVKLTPQLKALGLDVETVFKTSSQINHAGEI